MAESSSEAIRIAFSVEDDGPGIDRGIAQRILSGSGEIERGQERDRGFGLKRVHGDLQRVGSRLEAIDRAGPTIAGFRFVMEFTPPGDGPVPRTGNGTLALVVGSDASDRESLTTALSALGASVEYANAADVHASHYRLIDHRRPFFVVVFTSDVSAGEVDDACRALCEGGAGHFARLARSDENPVLLEHDREQGVMVLARKVWASEIADLLQHPQTSTSEPGHRHGPLETPRGFADRGRLLLVENREDSRIQIASNLINWGVKSLTIAADGPSAVTAAKESEFALILLDIHLDDRDFDGYRVSREIREAESTEATGSTTRHPLDFRHRPR